MLEFRYRRDVWLARIRRGTLVLGLALLWNGALLRPAVAAPEESATVSLGSVAGLPNAQVMVPLYFTPGPPETRVARLTATVRFENGAVSFVNTVKGIVLDSSNGTLELKAADDPADAKQSLLHLEVSTGEGQRFPEGVLLYLTFNIKPEAPAGTKVTLNWQKPEASSAATSGGATVPLEAKDGTIDVILPEQTPYVACFFFTH